MKRRVVTLGCITLAVILIVLGVLAALTLLPFFSKENITETVELEGCRFISGVMGPEDFEYLPEENGLVVSSIDRRASEDTLGQLYWIDLASPPEEQTAEPIVTDYPDHFRPHGITFQQTKEGGRLFVISHPSEGEWPHTIEVFSLTSSAGAHEWKHIQTITGELLISPNDLVALQDGSLFIANDFQGLGGSTGLIVDVLLQRKRAPLLYYNGKEFMDLNANVISAPGITAVTEGNREFLYLSDTMNNTVQKLEIHWDAQGNPSVELVETIDLNSSPDNFTVDEQGNVYVAAHHSFGLLLAHMADANTKSPTQVFKILPSDDYTLIYANKGEEISTGSVGAIVGDRLFIGQIFDDGILSCPLNG